MTAGGPIVSVIVPFCEDGAFIDRALESIAAQTVREFEVVMSSDKATDGGREICLAWSQKDPRFRLVENRSRLGMTENWNRALTECRGEYVVKLDADDAMRPRFIELAWNEFQRDAKTAAVFCRTLDCDSALEPQSSYLGERVLWARGIDPLTRHVKSGPEWLRLCFDGYQLWHSNACMMRRRFLETLGGWDVRWGCAPDTDLILRILETGGQVVHLPYCGILYRRRPGSVSDKYEAMGWKAVEGVLVHLGSLRRQYRNAYRCDRASIRAWYKYWESWRELARHASRDGAAGLPPGLGAKTIEGLTREVAPPLGLRSVLSLRRAVGAPARAVRRMRQYVAGRPRHRNADGQDVSAVSTGGAPEVR